MNKKKAMSAPHARRVCCTTFHDQAHRSDCAFKARSVKYNAELKARLARARGGQS